jgi:hypothetical protein
MGAVLEATTMLFIPTDEMKKEPSEPKIKKEE